MPHNHQTRPGFLGMPPPDEDGPIGSAWIFPGLPNPDIPPGQDRMIQQWLVWCPLITGERAHWLVTILSLEPSTFPPPIPAWGAGLTHMLGISAIVDSLPMDPATPGGITLLPKPNVAYQFAATGADACKVLLRKVVQGIVRGRVFPEPGPIAGVGHYHAEVLTAMLEASDPGWHLTRGARPGARLSQQEWQTKTWRITKDRDAFPSLVQNN